MLAVSSQLVHRKPTLISAVILVGIITAIRNRNKPVAMESAKVSAAVGYKRTDTLVLVMINQLFHKGNVLLMRCHFFIKRSSLGVILEDRIQDAEDQDQSYLSLNTYFLSKDQSYGIGKLRNLRRIQMNQE